MFFNRLKDLFDTPWKRTLYIIFFAQTMTAVGFSSIFPFLPLYVKDLGAASGASIELLAGLVYSSQAFTMMLASPFWGSLADRYGRKLMVERALFSGAILLFLMAFVRNAEELVLLRTIQGFLTGTVAAANALVASEAPRERSGYAMGLLQVSLGAGVALGPLLGGFIADQVSYRAAFYVPAALLLVAGFSVAFGVHETFQRPAGMAARTSRMISQWRGIIFSQVAGIAYLLRFLSQLGSNMLTPIAPLFIQQLVRDTTSVNTMTGLVIGVSSATTTISAVYLGRLGDRLGHRRIIIASAPAAVVLYVLQSLVANHWQLLVLQALVGVAIGGIVPSISALLARFTHHGEEGAVFGLDNSITSAARTLAPLIGAGVALSFDLRATFVATAVIFAVMGLIAMQRLPKAELVTEQSPAS